VLTGTVLPIAISSLRRSGELVPRLAAFCMPPAFALVIAATLSPTAHRLGENGQCGKQLTTSGRPGDGIVAGIRMSAAVEAVQALVPQLGRSCQLHDLIANSLGAVCGVGLAAGLQTLTRARRLLAGPLVVEHAGLLVLRSRPSPRHRRGRLVTPRRSRAVNYH